MNVDAAVIPYRIAFGFRNCRTVPETKVLWPADFSSRGELVTVL
jgi:hypothetical protein